MPQPQHAGVTQPRRRRQHLPPKAWNRELSSPPPMATYRFGKASCLAPANARKSHFVPTATQGAVSPVYLTRSLLCFSSLGCSGRWLQTPSMSSGVELRRQPQLPLLLAVPPCVPASTRQLVDNAKDLTLTAGPAGCLVRIRTSFPPRSNWRARHIHVVRLQGHETGSWGATGAQCCSCQHMAMPGSLILTDGMRLCQLAVCHISQMSSSSQLARSQQWHAAAVSAGVLRRQRRLGLPQPPCWHPGTAASAGIHLASRAAAACQSPPRFPAVLSRMTVSRRWCASIAVLPSRLATPTAIGAGARPWRPPLPRAVGGCPAVGPACCTHLQIGWGSSWLAGKPAVWLGGGEWGRQQQRGGV